jgi:hypothetical protein
MANMWGSSFWYQCGACGLWILLPRFSYRKPYTESTWLFSGFKCYTSYPLCSTAFEMYRMADHFMPMVVYSDCHLANIRQVSTQLSWCSPCCIWLDMECGMTTRWMVHGLCPLCASDAVYGWRLSGCLCLYDLILADICSTVARLCAFLFFPGQFMLLRLQVFILSQMQFYGVWQLFCIFGFQNLLPLWMVHGSYTLTVWLWVILAA